ncbi:MAG: Gfo/Idh/MocA family oxidoreductase [Chloroflexi bacterium]|nr:Gfo/Idh/MocA family oxidoreductase [Chloroflexota bacterium]
MNPRPVRVAMIGAGTMANTHAEALMRDGRATITGVFDPLGSAASTFVDRWGGEVAPSIEALLAPRPDAVYITSPNVKHVEPVLAALTAGIHVFCEKPMATSLDGAARVRDAVRASGRVYQIGFNRRHAPVYREAKRLIETGTVQPRWGHVKMNRGELLDPPWLGDESVTGGFLYESTIHMLDMLRWLLGDVAEVQGIGARTASEQFDDFALTLRFRSGVVTTLCSSAHATWMFPYERIELFGVHTSLVTEELDRVSVTQGPRAPVESTDMTMLSRLDKSGYAAEDSAFLDAVLGLRPPSPDAEDGYRAVELVEACYRAVATGERVAL